jgi:probable rRNA maturation factor
MNRPTDVLSFSSEDAGYLGDLAICVPYASREAKRRAIPVTEELVRLLVHGTLHLSGYDHATAKQEEVMFRLQERIVESII